MHSCIYTIVLSIQIVEGHRIYQQVLALMRREIFIWEEQNASY